MSKIQWDQDELEQKIIELFVKHIGVRENDAQAPVHEIRARFEVAGTLIGRTLAVVNHDGPIGADIALKIRRYEEEYKERCRRSVGNLWGPNGKLRNHFSQTPDQE